MSRAMSQNSPTPQGNNYLNFQLACHQVVHLETAANLCVTQAIEVRQRFSLEKVIIQEKRFIIRQKHIEVENLNILYLHLN